MGGTEVIKSFLVGLGFGVDEKDLANFNKAIASASLKVLGLYASIKASAAGIFYSIAKISEGFEEVGYNLRLVAPAVNKMLLLRAAMLDAYRRAGINLQQVVRQSILFNFSLAKTKFAVEALYKGVAARFFPLLTKQMDIFRAKIFANMPKIQDSLEKLIKFIFQAFSITVQFGARLWDVLSRVWTLLKQLDGATNGWSTAILGFVAAWKFLNLSFLLTPFGMVIAGITALIALYDDFKVWQEGGQSLIDWGSKTTQTVLGIVAAVGTLGAVIGGVVLAMRAWAVAQGVVNALMLLNPVGLVIAGVVTLIGLLTVLFYKLGALKGLGDWLGGLGSKVEGFLGGAGAASALVGPTQPAPLVPQQSGGVNQRLHQETNILVQGTADANSTGRAVADQQGKVNSDLTRNMKRGSEVSFLSQPLSFFSIGPTRSFAGISGYVTVQESTQDALEITQQPVQQGASISDHAFKKPVSLSIQILFADNIIGQSLPALYQSLLALQQPVPPAVLTPFNVVTPKRTYYNMLLSALGCTTDKKTENILAINATFQEVIIVPVMTTAVPRSQLSNPGSNGATQTVGQKSSILFNGAQAVKPFIPGGL